MVGRIHRNDLGNCTKSSTGWSTPVELPRLGYSGGLKQAVVEWAAAQEADVITVRVGHDHDGTLDTADASAWSDSQIAWEYEGLAITGASGSQNLNIEKLTGGEAPYGGRCWVAINVTSAGGGGGSTDLNVSLDAAADGV